MKHSLPAAHRPALLPLLPLAMAAALTACGGSGDDSPSPSPAAAASPKTGVFLDSAVQGLDVAAGSAATQTTSARGEFSCLPGDTVSFTLGGLALGSAACADVLTPLELAGVGDGKDASVVNRLLALQLLDEDNDPANGISIAPGVKTALAGRSLNFSAPQADFDAALATVLQAAGAAYAARGVDADRRALAREHFEDTLASRVGKPQVERFTQASATLGPVSVDVTRYQVRAADAFNIPYEGSDAAVRADFPKGFLPSYGSSLAFRGRNAAGELEFYGLTDRGPNGDGPNVPAAGGTLGSKIFPSPGFAPAIGLITVGKDGAVLRSSMPIKASAHANASGLPIPAGSLGNSAEVPVLDAMKYDAATKAVYDANGLDSEAVVFDAQRNALWVSDEYGPFILKLDAATGVIQARYAPGSGLPAILAKRRANRGMEGMALDAGTGRLHAFLQSPLSDGKSLYSVTAKQESVERYARFTRWVEFDPASGSTTRMYAYPLDPREYQDGRTGNAKLGEMVSLGNGKFIVIEQGAGPDGKVFNHLMLVSVGNATDIAAAGFNPATADLEKSSMAAAAVNGADWSQVVPLTKTLLLDLNAVGWMAEKAEGLALVDGATLALANDNDFGLKTQVFTPDGQAVADADVTKCTVDADGNIVTSANAGCTAGNHIRVERGEDRERPSRLWLIRFGKALSSY